MCEKEFIPERKRVFCPGLHGIPKQGWTTSERFSQEAERSSVIHQ